MPAMWPAEATLAAAAQALGRDALPWFVAALLALLAAVGLAGWVLLGHARRGNGERLVSIPGLAVRLGVGFGIIVAAALIFATLAEAVEAGKVLGRIDNVLSAAVGQSTPERARQAFAWLTHLGDPATLAMLGIVVAIILLAAGEYTLTAGWIVALAGNAVLNPVLKSIFERARPVHDQAAALVSGWSFPSGHSSGSVVAYGMLAYLAIRTLAAPWHLPALLAATAVAFTTGCSRIFLQVHYATDVVAGFASGLAWLAICVGSIETATHYRRRRAARGGARRSA
jgi:membrane-associated phospholipid phosphatase